MEVERKRIEEELRGKWKIDLESNFYCGTFKYAYTAINLCIEIHNVRIIIIIIKHLFSIFKLNSNESNRIAVWRQRIKSKKE